MGENGAGHVWGSPLRDQVWGLPQEGQLSGQEDRVPESPQAMTEADQGLCWRHILFVSQLVSRMEHSALATDLTSWGAQEGPRKRPHTCIWRRAQRTHRLVTVLSGTSGEFFTGTESLGVTFIHVLSKGDPPQAVGVKGVAR